jgi:hypothetical protein
MIAPFSRAQLATCLQVLEHLRVEFAFRAGTNERPPRARTENVRAGRTGLARSPPKKRRTKAIPP